MTPKTGKERLDKLRQEREAIGIKRPATMLPTTPPPNWPFPTWNGKPLPKPKRQPRPAYPVAPPAPF